MGTRGFVGFVADGTEKIAYNHNDSYPSHLGINTLGWLRAADLDVAADAARALRVVASNSRPSTEDIDRLARWTNLAVGHQSVNDWYCLLRETQGDPAAMLAAGVIEDAGEFPMDSLFAEWGYLVDFDTKTFEVYRGFQHGSHTKGRFAQRTPADTGYAPVALVASWPLDALPDDDAFMAVDDEDD